MLFPSVRIQLTVFATVSLNILFTGWKWVRIVKWGLSDGGLRCGVKCIQPKIIVVSLQKKTKSYSLKRVRGVAFLDSWVCWVLHKLS